jgi:hypothetical protein
MQQGILRDFERKVTKGDSRAFNVDPLRGDREQLLEIIYDVSPIKHPREAFKHFITPVSVTLVQEQVILYMHATNAQIRTHADEHERTQTETHTNKSHRALSLPLRTHYSEAAGYGC